MIFEYAIEPQALSKFNPLWQALEQCGIPNGRLIAEFPVSWRRLVYDATQGCPPVQRKALEVRLQTLGSKLIRLGRSYDSKKEWRENVKLAHNSSPFRAIIQADNAESRPEILTEMDLHDQNPLWYVSTQIKVNREPCSMSSVVSLLGRISREILFIDPHFTADKRWTTVLHQILLDCRVDLGKHSRIEFHTSDKTNKDFLEAEAWRHIAPRLPSTSSIKFLMWKERDKCEKLHARYILTEKGGIGFDVGLDSGALGATTDVRLLSQELYLARWRDFQISTSAFELVGSFEIRGQSK